MYEPYLTEHKPFDLPGVVARECRRLRKELTVIPAQQCLDARVVMRTPEYEQTYYQAAYSLFCCVSRPLSQDA